MSTPQQIAANRQNAQRSTGPRSLEGKAASRFNALQSGIDAQSEVIPGENPAQLQALLAEYQQRWSTDTPERRMLVDTLVNAEWMLRRIRRGEASLWNYSEEHRLSETAHPQGREMAGHDKIHDRIQRRINSIQRNYLAALKELQRIEDREPAEELQPLAPQPSQNQQPDPQIGFVPPTPVEPALPPAASVPERVGPSPVLT